MYGKGDNLRSWASKG